MQKYATSYDEISDITLFPKIKFLEKHGFFFIEKIVQRDLRNAVAHQDYMINSNGEIELYRKKKLVRTITFKELADIAGNITELFSITIETFGEKMGVDQKKIMEGLSTLSLEQMITMVTQYTKNKFGK